ncbi:Signal transduction histidine kinase [Actinacidiphila yanglinensis]|uniref:histidine kinase n=1 Tax=Actinacidiphila yanglinensis TaxID=310779 RepID=A0A1H5VJM0_9ACTN|nr:nitrate- and nitrite sensing domain-containing protein [Actinacidiphila yanglinensis]SEF87410.1 Signal transduction histidine kinase [Actinacidiphila yanglinensis]
MLAALLVCAAIVLAAAAPGVALAAGDLSAAQHRVGAARLAYRATALAADLADERDDLAASLAAGHPAASAADRQRTDRQVTDVAAAGGMPADLRAALATLPTVRRSALAASSAAAAIAVYQPLVDAVDRTAGPDSAPLGRATSAAAVQRGLLVAGLTAGGSQRALLADAQAARLQERAALVEFHATAPAGVRNDYDQTVTGADTAEADHDLDRLLGGTELTSGDRDLGTKKVAAALDARLALMRGVESSAASDEAAGAASHRDHEVTVVELRAALAALCLILLVSVLVTLFRTVNRPLAALHRWSRADPEGGQGTEVVGTDEFSAVARRVNALTSESQALRARARELTAERTEAEAARTALAADHQAALLARAELARTRDDLMRSREEIAERLGRAVARNALQAVHVNLSLRTLGLVERQLTLIEGMEEHEQEPERLATLFRLDHLATRMRRNSENLLVLTGTEHSHGATARPVPLIDVARAAISEVERYERVRILAVPEAEVAGRAADDVSHLLAELLDNATAFSAPGDEVLLSGWVQEGGGVMIAVEDAGIGVPGERAGGLNALLADPDPAPPGAAAGIGLYVVARLAHRHGVRVELGPRAGGGTTAMALLPRLLVPTVDPLSRVLPAQRGTSAEPVYGAEPGAMTASVAGSAVSAAGPGSGYGTDLSADFGADLAAEFGADLGPDFGADFGAGLEVPLPAASLGRAHQPAMVQPADAPPAGPLPAEPPPAEPLPPESRLAEPLPAPSAPPLPPQPLPRRSAAPPRVRVERLHVTPAQVPSAGLADVQVQPRTAEPPSAAGPGRAPEALGRPASGPVPVAGAGPAPEPVASAEHARAEYAPRHAVAAPAGDAAPDGQPLPRRVRQATGLRTEARGGGQTPRRTQPLDAEGLRRKLAGLQRGLRDGRRDAELETRPATEPAGASAAPPATAASPGDTVEEATR